MQVFILHKIDLSNNLDVVRQKWKSDRVKHTVEVIAFEIRCVGLILRTIILNTLKTTIFR